MARLSKAIRQGAARPARGDKPVERRARLGDRLLHIGPPARAVDQAGALPGTEWRELPGGGCDLVVTDPAAYGRFIWGSDSS